MLLGLALFLLLLVQVFSKIHDPAYRGSRGWRNLHQVQVLFAGHFQGFVGRQNSDLLAFIVNDADFTRPNTIVDADKTLIDTTLRLFPGKTLRSKIITDA
jgi:hypothetical protein